MDKDLAPYYRYCPYCGELLLKTKDDRHFECEKCHEKVDVLKLDDWDRVFELFHKTRFLRIVFEIYIFDDSFLRPKYIQRYKIKWDGSFKKFEYDNSKKEKPKLVKEGYVKNIIKLHDLMMRMRETICIPYDEHLCLGHQLCGRILSLRFKGVTFSNISHMLYDPLCCLDFFDDPTLLDSLYL